jgi:hypothetical protein
MLVLKNNRCVFESKTFECESGSYYDFESTKDTVTCGFCDLSCVECSSNKEDACIKCPTRRPYLQKGRCVYKCDNGFYLDEITSSCLECDLNCLNCSKTKNECTQCLKGFTLDYKNQCTKGELLNGTKMLLIFFLCTIEMAGIPSEWSEFRSYSDDFFPAFFTGNPEFLKISIFQKFLLFRVFLVYYFELLSITI